MGKLIDNNKAGVIWIAFKENVLDESIQEAVNDFYVENKDKIEGMEFTELDCVKSMREGKKLAKESWKDKDVTDHD